MFKVGKCSSRRLLNLTLEAFCDEYLSYLRVAALLAMTNRNYGKT